MEGSSSLAGIPGGTIRTLVLAVILVFVGLLSSCSRSSIKEVQAQDPAGETRPAGKDVRIMQSFSGDYPVTELHRLPSAQEKSGTGCIGSAQEFAAVWQAMFPAQKLPEIDFTKHIVVFSRNTHFYNRTSIGNVVLKDGAAHVLVMETMSSLPIEDKVSMALAVIPRVGVRFIKTETGLTPVPGETPADPLHAAYTVEGREVRLFHGSAEEAAAPGSAGKTTTSVFGKPVFGDLDNDGDDDAALILASDPGGSGVFYYVAAALNMNGSYRGTNAVFLGDRIVPRDVGIQDGEIVVRYTERGEAHAMTSPPSVSRTRYLKVEKGVLAETEPPGMH